MPSITLTFPNSINVSAQVGDTAYYTNDVNGETIVEIGTITAINIADNSITCNIAAGTVRPTVSSFILFSKNNEPNIGAMVGAYAVVKLKNESTSYGEIFSTGIEVFESSK
jgi:hypothetical protein|tara:strand:+ start:1493 stop:1825 length:333 start_codon:yes stop_codon:yes gene_type:complete